MVINETERLLELFRRTMILCKEDAEIIEKIEKSKRETDIGDFKDVVCSDITSEKMTCLVTRHKTFGAALKLKQMFPEDRVAALNFASPVQPGGGAIFGYQAQEEYLCRCSTLYSCLNTKELWEKYYLANRFGSTRRYNDVCIFTPNVVVFRTDDSYMDFIPREEWAEIDMITAAAPSLNSNDLTLFGVEGADFEPAEGELFEIHKDRAKSILNCACSKGAKHIVLGAFGCGAFANDPETVARAYKEILPLYEHKLKTVIFAVYCSDANTYNFDVFSRILSE